MPHPAAPTLHRSSPTTGAMVRAALHVAIAHHPLCGTFQDDIFRWGRLRVCRGCVLAGSMFLVGAIIAWTLHSMGVFVFFIAVTGLILGIPQVTGTLSRRRRPVRRMIDKLAGGLGLGLLLISILLAPLAFTTKIALFFSMGLAFLGLQTIRAHKILVTCRACPWQMDWDQCPGLAGAGHDHVPLPPRIPAS